MEAGIDTYSLCEDVEEILDEEFVKYVVLVV